MFKQIITDKLDALGLKWVDSGDGYLLSQCINPKHNDSHPSMFISTEECWSKCTSCDYYAPPSFFIEDNNDMQDLLLQSRFNTIIDRLNERFQPLKAPPQFHLPPYSGETGDYRGLSADFMKQIGAYTCDTGRFNDRIIFPFYNHEGKLVGYTGRYIGDSTDKAIPKYMHSTGIQPSDHILFGELIKELNLDATTLIVTEGSHDAYHLIQKGIAATPSLGFRTPSDNWVLESIALGVEQVVLAWDNDNVGLEKMVGSKSLYPKWKEKIPTTLGLFHKDTKFLYKSKFKDFGEYYEWLNNLTKKG